MVSLLATGALAGKTTYVLMDDSNGTKGMSLYSGENAHVEYVTSSSGLARKEIDTIQIRLSRVGNPAGTATVGVFDGELVLVKVFGTIDAGSVSTSYQDYMFSLGDANDGYMLQPGDGVGIFYDGGDAGNRLSILADTEGLFDGRKTYYRHHAAGWTSEPGADLHMRLTSDRDSPKDAPKYVMVHFDDGFQSQYDHAHPVLEQYGMKGTFWIVCSYASGPRPLYMAWPEIDQLVADGHDIQNHGMTHAHLQRLTDDQIAQEVGGCKEMVVQHSSTGDAFAIPFNEGDDDQRVVTAISKFHSFGKGDGGSPQPADCGGNCELLNGDGTYNKDNRYTMMQWSHDTYSAGRTEQEILDGFKRAVSTGNVDSAGIVKIPIVTYHQINAGGASPSASLFASEMQYLRDNGFTALGMDDITYDAAAKKFRLK